MLGGFGCCFSVVIYVMLVVDFTSRSWSTEFMENGHMHAPRFHKDGHRSLDATNGFIVGL